MDAEQLSQMIQRQESEADRLLKLMESLSPTHEVIVRTYLTDDTRDPWRGDYANLEQHSRRSD
jgi:hypothetical protein